MTGLLARRRILVVEDEMLVLMNIEMALMELGCSAISAVPSVAAALALLSQQNFDLALVDVNLGGEKSYPVADALTQRGIPFAFSTGYGDHGARIDLDDRLVLRKPYLRAHLVAVFKQLLSNEPWPAAA
jgi:CheY-like chemotaxis protein